MRQVLWSEGNLVMHLTPEQREVGKDNYHEVVGSLDSRRDFLKKGVGAGLVSGAGMGAMYFNYGDAKSIKNPLRVGVIGTGDEGSVLIGAINPEYVQVVAIADIRPYNIHRAFHGDWYSKNALAVRPGLMSKYEWKTEDDARKHVKVYTDSYEELLDDADVEAVIIALPLHLHDVAAISAMRKGKHVLTEKLMGHSVHQCKEMARVAAQTEMLLATGHQRHYSVLYDNAMDIIRQGLIGDIHFIRAQWHRGNLPGRDSWQPTLPSPASFTKRDYDLGIRAAREQKKEAEFKAAYKLMAEVNSFKGKLKNAKPTDVETWQKRLKQKEMQLQDAGVVAENYGYEEKTLQDGQGTKRSALEELIRWRLWDRTGGGLMAELGSHQLDAAGLFITANWNNKHKALPLSVVAVGGRSIFPVDRDADDHVYCTFEYPGPEYYKDVKKREVADENKKIVVTYSSINGNGMGGHGETVYGTKGTMMLEREKDVLLFKNASTSRIEVKKKDDSATIDTTESGPSPAAALAKAAEGPVSRGYTEEIEHWAWCIRNPDPQNVPRCHPKVALADAVIALTSNIAIKKQERMEFNPKWFDIDSDETPENVAPRKASSI